MFIKFLLFIIIFENTYLLSQDKVKYLIPPINNYNIISDSANNDNKLRQDKSILAIQLRSGIKFPESSSHPYATKLGFYGGISFIFILSNTIDLQPEINYSNSPAKNSPNNISTKEIAIILGLKHQLNIFTIKYISGLGLLSKSGDPHNSESDKLLALNLGIEFSKKISSTIYGSLEVRKQWANSLEPGGGSTFNPLIINLGISYAIPKLINQ